MFYSRKKPFRIECEIFRIACEIFCISFWQSPPDRVTLNQSASPLSSLYHPKAISVTNKQIVSALLKIHSFAKRWPKKVFLPSFYDGKIDGQTSQRTNELTVNLHLMFFTFFSRKKHFRIVCEIFRITSQHHPKTDSVTPKQSASPLSSLHHPKALSITPKQ